MRRMIEVVLTHAPGLLHFDPVIDLDQETQPRPSTIYARHWKRLPVEIRDLIPEQSIRLRVPRSLWVRVERLADLQERLEREFS
jgi:hypothetical protein